MYYIYKDSTGSIVGRGAHKCDMDGCTREEHDSEELALAANSEDIATQAASLQDSKDEVMANTPPRVDWVYAMKFAEAQRVLIEGRDADPRTYVFLADEAEDEGISLHQHATSVIQNARDSESTVERARRNENRELRLSIAEKKAKST